MTYREMIDRISRYFFNRPGLLIAALASAYVFQCTHPLWGDEIGRGGDVFYHLASGAQVIHAMERGQSPTAPADIMFGSPMFKFYQPLTYWIAALFHFIFGVSMNQIFNLIVLLCFALSPFALRWSYQALGLHELAAGMAAFVAITSVAAFGNSFEAHYLAGIITQSMGVILFPLFMGFFVQMLRGSRGPIAAALLFGTTFISHAAMAVYAAFAGALFFIVSNYPIRRVWRRLVAFGLLGFLLVAFWVVPFISYQERYRPVSNLILRPSRVMLYAGTSPAEQSRLLFSGRLFDDARASTTEEQNDDDKLIDTLNIMGTLKTRPPFLTVLVLLGFVLCLTRFRSLPHRFLLTGFLFCMILHLGPDDVPWLKWIPFMGRIEVFRVVYLLEYFAFGLVGAGLHILVTGPLAALAAGIPRLRKPAILAGCAFVMVGAGLLLPQVKALGETHVKPRPHASYKRLIKIASKTREEPEFRVADHYKDHNKKINAFMAYHGLRSICGHWGSATPSISRLLCMRLRNSVDVLPLARRLGVGYHITDRIIRAKALAINKKGEPPILKPIGEGHGHFLFRDLQATYPWAATRTALVVCSDRQWFYLVRGWLNRTYRPGPNRREPPVPMRAPSGEAIDPELLAIAQAAWILAPEQLGDAARAGLARFQKSGGQILSTSPIEGVTTFPIPTHGYNLLAAAVAPVEPPPVTFLKRRAQVAGPMDYTVTAEVDSLVVLPEMAVDGWRVTIDGEETTTIAAAYDLVGVRVPEGRHEIRFWWETPGSDIALTLVAVITFLLLCSVAVFLRMKGRTV